jgi:hypothetical protein
MGMRNMQEDKINEKEITYLCAGKGSHSKCLIGIYGAAGLRPCETNHVTLRYIVLDGDSHNFTQDQVQGEGDGICNTMMHDLKKFLKSKYGINQYRGLDGVNVHDLWKFGFPDKEISELESYLIQNA